MARASVDNQPPAFFTDVQTEINKTLASFLEAKVRAAGAIGKDYKDLLDQISQLVQRGGKRLRPILVLLAYRGYGGKSPAIMQVSLSQELLHGFLLIHDDIIDGDQQRWGGPNISGYYHPIFEKHVSKDSARQHADNWALLAGDACLSMAEDLLLGADFPAVQLLAAGQLMQEVIFSTVGGELADTALTLPAAKKPTTQELLTIARYKTAGYSFCLPLQVGAMLANAPESELARLKTFAEHLGIAYQLTDDRLDNQLTGSKLAQLTALAEQYLAKALALVPQLGLNSDAAQQLTELSEFCIHRSV